MYCFKDIDKKNMLNVEILEKLHSYFGTSDS